MGFDVADAPFLRRFVILKAIQMNISAMLDEFPIYALFLELSGGTPLQMDALSGLIDTVYNERRAALWHMDIGLGDRLVQTRVGQKAVQLVFNHLSDNLSPTDMKKLREVGMGGDDNMPAEGGAVGALTRRVAKILENHTRAILRSREQLCCNLLSTASFSFVADGVTNTITTGLTVVNMGGNFATASTDIPALMGIARRKFITQAGEEPDCIIYSFLQEDNFSGNDKIRAWAVNQLKGNTASITDIPLELLPVEMRSAQIIKHKSHYKNDSGTLTYYWPATVLTMLSKTQRDNVLGWLTTNIAIRDWANPGQWRDVSDIWEHRYHDDRTLIEYVDTHAVGGAYVGDESKIIPFSTAA